jgi:tetratricopeptide (TPR) repeat protein
MLRELANAKKFEQLEPLAEKWLKLHPGDKDTLVLVAMATANTGNLERCVECLEEIYLKEPSPELARDIFSKYQAIKNLAKQIEWADKLFKMQEFDTDYKLRYDFVTMYMGSNNYPKATEYARLALKSADLVESPDAKIADELRILRRGSNHVIGMHMMEQDKWQEAIEAFTRALKAERYDLGYFYIAMCLENQKKVEEAMVEYAKAELQRGEVEAKAKERLELLYKALHNDTTIGIDKKYRQAKEELAAESANARLN